MILLLTIISNTFAPDSVIIKTDSGGFDFARCRSIKDPFGSPSSFSTYRFTYSCSFIIMAIDVALFYFLLELVSCSGKSFGSMKSFERF
jgi:hypothetical protein